jgi:uncharacterized repeat protein (TIGR01451 family)
VHVWWRARIVLFVVCVVVGFAASAQAVDIETLTNGQDADAAPGPGVLVGSTVNWTYVVTNTGGRELTNVNVTDDHGVTVTCPATTLDAGLSFTCTASGVAVAGQYANVGTVNGTLADASVTTDSDPSHYFGQSALSVTIEKRTNGFDADTPPGPYVPTGSTVHWTYVIGNVGTEDLTNIVVTDDHGVSISCPGTTLAPGLSMTCTASGLAQSGQYANVGTVTAMLMSTGERVTADDASHYFGQQLRLTKRTNGIESDTPPGPTIEFGTTVTWTYEVTNPGPTTVTGLSVTDDQGVTVTCPQTTLIAGETVTCSATGIAEAEQYTNVGTATAMLPAGSIVSVSDASYYFGTIVGIEKQTNGVDADTPSGPSLNVGDAVNWTYIVTNFGSETLINVAVSDDQGVIVTCPGTTLIAGSSMTCTASGVAVAGQYANIGTVFAESPTFGGMSASDASHYFGQTVALDFGDAPSPYPSLFAANGAQHQPGSTLFLGACVDAEADALENAGATGDDAGVGTPFGNCTNPGDDEDGVTFTSAIRAGFAATVDVVASQPCTLSAWIDFSADGDWIDSGEDLFPGGTPLVAGTNALSFAVPASSGSGLSYARFRCTTAGAVAPTGSANDGEVEDYAVTLVVPAPLVTATKSDALFVDVDGDTVAEPDDTLLYTITLTNSGDGAATGVTFSDTPDANSALVAGSVTTTAGSVTTGNTAGDGAVLVNVGTLAMSGSATIAFRVTIDNAPPANTTSVSNQGTVAGTNFGDVLTDDPSAAGAADPTVTPIVLTPVVTASKTDALLVDVDGDTIADPGDTLRYTVVITNSGSSDATAIAFTDTPDANTALVTGSVTTTTGAIATGNNGGDASVSVNVGTLTPSTSATVAFDVTIDNPPPANTTTVSNQGTVSGSNFANVLTDDPAVGGAFDSTITPLVPAPAVIATKTATLRIDLDGDHQADPGDTLRYTITVTNNGTGNALAVTFNDTPDANSAIDSGSVTTSAGIVTSGNLPGQTSVTVDVGTLAALGGAATIVFDVRIDAPLAPGVTQIVNSGTVSGSNFPSAQTDDPSQPGNANPTTFAVAASTTDIPTLDPYALIALLVMASLFAMWRIARI